MEVLQSPPPESELLSAPCRKQCIELEQQFDFLKDLVASVPDMQGDVEDNHAEGEKVSRRWAVGGAALQGAGQGLSRGCSSLTASAGQWMPQCATGNEAGAQ